MDKNKIDSTACELTILMPCLNEAETLAICVDKAISFLRKNNINGEVIIADNGSTDGSQKIAEEHGARVVDVKEKGYGSALTGGINAAKGKYVIMGDSDDSYDFTALSPFVEKLREGYELVMGNRFKGGIKPGAMPPLHKYLGNPVLSGIGRLFFPSDIKDFHCGLRGFNTESIKKLGLITTGMEFASEMVVKATINKLKIIEVPTTLDPDGRSHPPHLRSWRDGWRHLRFLLMYSPRWLFLYPGAIMFVIGLIAMIGLITGAKTISGITFDIHTMLYSSIAIMLGFQIISFALFTKVFAINTGLMPDDNRIMTIKRIFTLERGIVIGMVLSICGLIGSIYAFNIWKETAFGQLVPTSMMHLTIPSLTSLVVGIQIIFTSFFLSILEIKHK